MWRVLFIALGLIFMISGCNGLISSQFGTHHLREVSIEDTRQGVGDADYIRVTGTEIREVAMDSVTSGTSEIRLFVLAGITERPVHGHLIFWIKADAPPASFAPDDLRGTVERPPDPTRVIAALKSAGVKLREPVTFVHLGEQPLSWPWHLLIFVGGIGLVLITEAVNHKKTHAETGVRS
ncbi:hypothetical protein [Lewinella sp. JB7]|uniref:hypothetical protein n=1 Tax=Lewinella sp. JB7 TaxID=2962887 RepID=UPI0020CA1B05|nr:hypothetical protein [Lewinella sp. JB7]MCP9235165.1 hypothetical protein [Lewinella sp. JB7]